MGEQINIVSGVGAGEGPAAARGHQSGEEGAAVEMPTFSPGDRNVEPVNNPLPGANSTFKRVNERTTA